MDNFQDQPTSQEAHAQPEHVPASQLEQCQTQLQELKNNYVRLSADFENYKKRQDKERAQWARLAQIEIVTPLLTIIDDFERALEQKPFDSEKSFIGFELIHKEFLKYLEKSGVKSIEVKANDPFNPELHESVMHEKADQDPDTIVRVLQKGYLLKDTVIRPAKVSVAS